MAVGLLMFTSTCTARCRTLLQRVLQSCRQSNWGRPRQLTLLPELTAREALLFCCCSTEYISSSIRIAGWERCLFPATEQSWAIDLLQGPAFRGIMPQGDSYAPPPMVRLLPCTTWELSDERDEEDSL